MVDGRTEVDDERIVCSNVLVLFVFVCVRSTVGGGVSGDVLNTRLVYI